MKQYLFLLLFVGITSAVTYLVLQEPSSPKTVVKRPAPVVPKADYQDRVNKHLHQTGLSMELRKEKVQTESVLNNAKPEVAHEGMYEEASSSDSDRMNDLVSKLNRGGNQQVVDNSSVETEIQNELYQDQRLREYDKAYRKAYIDQFIANARREGYEIKVDYETLKIQSVRQLPR